MRRGALGACLTLLVLFSAIHLYANEPRAGLSLTTLKNMTYKSEFTQSKRVKLVDGTYSEQAAPGSATWTRVTLADKAAYGTLNGKPAAAVILVTDPGGSGTFYDLAAVIVRKDKPVNVALTNLGDRVTINALSIQENRIIVDLVTQGAHTPMASPSRQVMQTYSLHGKSLVLVSSKNGEPAASLSGTIWQWETLQGSTKETIAVDRPGNYTIAFLPDGKVSIRADCNRGSGTYRVKGNHLAISILALTRAACPPESLSDQYIRYLNDVASYAFESGRVSLNLKMGGGSMVFTPGN